MADCSILISKYIQQILEESEEVTAIVGTDQHKIFPLLQPDNLKFPFIVHSRNSISVTYNKDLEFGNIGWTNEIEYIVSCVSNDYIQALELANAVRHSLEGYRWYTEDFHMHPIQVSNISEWTTDTDTFVQELHFKIYMECH